MMAFLVLFTLHPFSTELYHFTDATPRHRLGRLVGGRWHLRSRDKPLPDAASHRRGCRPIVAALSIYQTAISFVVTVCLLVFGGEAGTSGDTRGRTRSLGPDRPEPLLAAVVSVPVYLVSVRIVATPCPESRAPVPLEPSGPGRPVAVAPRACQLCPNGTVALAGGRDPRQYHSF